MFKYDDMNCYLVIMLNWKGRGECDDDDMSSWWDDNDEVEYE